MTADARAPAAGASHAHGAPPPGSAPRARRYADGAPPGHTGGFGQPTCARCHFDAVTSDEGRVRVRGFPRVWAPGEEYPLEVRLRSPRMARGGFQLSARFGDGRQAGCWRATGAGVGVAGPDSAGVRYPGHVEPATPGSDGWVAWRLVWIAPPEPGPAVHVHAAANAANGDDSEFGDAVYTDSLTSEPVGPAAPGAHDGTKGEG